MPEVVRSPRGGRDYVIALPGSWTIVPLETNRAAAEAIGALVTLYVGRDDRRARLRRELRERVGAMVHAAREGGVEFLAVAPELVPGVPFGGALTARTIGWPADAEPLTAAARTVGDSAHELAGRSERMVAVDYAVPTPTPSESVLVLAFSVSESTIPVDALLPLFDTIVEAIAWVDPDARA